jgi:two-component system sensor histidine kinase KdpD
LLNHVKNHTGAHALKAVVVFVLSVGCSLGMNLLGVGKESIIMVFLLGVLFTSVLTGSTPWGFLHSIASLMVLNYLFTEPRFTFFISSSNDFILLLFFLITAVVSSTVTLKLQKQIAISARNESTAKILYQTASGFLPVSGKKSIVHQGMGFIKEYAGFDNAVLLQGEDIHYSDPSMEAQPHLVFAIQSNQLVLGELWIFNGQRQPDPQSELIIQAVATQLAIALDRENLYVEREEIRIAMEREHLRSTLLRSVAHDLRTPLTGLSGAATLLADNGDTLSEGERQQLAMDMSEEIIWLTSLVENILNMTRINDAQLLLHKEDEVIDDMVSQALSHVSRLMKDRSFTVHLPEDVLLVKADGKLVVQVLINLLENAIRHTSGDSLISLEVEKKERHLQISVCDTGDGIDDSIKATIFEQFVTLDRTITDGKRGIGLGLAICKAIVDAHGGTIFATDNQPKGTCMVFTLPLEEPSWNEK